MPEPTVVSPVLRQSRGWPTGTETWFDARGHYGGTSEALVRISPPAHERYRQHTFGSEFEPGTTLVMLHRSKATGKPGRVHVMKKGPDSWQFSLLDADGTVLERPPLSLCARCHAEAVSDAVFGPPRLHAAE